MKFGKHIQAHQVPGWSGYYLDYKFLKKIISSLAANRPASEAASLALGIRPTDASPSLEQQSPLRPPIISSLGQDEDRGPDFQAHKAAFFFKLERELEKINAFYLEREAQLKLRLETLLSKRRAAALRWLPDSDDTDRVQSNAEWSAVEEGFRILERDLGKLQQFVETNATGFRKILKKYDKRSTSTTKELYLSRQVDVQPVFNRQLISELSDTVAACLVDITDLSSGIKFESSSANDIFAQQIMSEGIPRMGPFRDLENNLRKAVSSADNAQITECVRYSDALLKQAGGATNVARILWSVILDSPPDLADLILASLSTPFDFQFADDINGRTCLHEASIAGKHRFVDLCISKGVRLDKTDGYGRSALHYACMNGHVDVCKRLLEAGITPDVLDNDNYSPLIYATLKGCAECVRVLIEIGKVPVERPEGDETDVVPLCIASQSGFVDIVRLFLQHGATSRPNANGEYPMHLAAKAGHPNVVQLLLHSDGWDTPDKYHEWTPIFHAARYGHGECVRILMDAGCRLDVRDETGQFALHYAALYGHTECLKLLLPSTPTLNVDPSTAGDVESPQSGSNVSNDIDLIPSLSLPPPIMPHKVYGHNYLDKSHLIQITVAGSWIDSTFNSGVRLHHRLMSPVFRDEYLLASAPLKLVTTSNVNSAAYVIPLPQQEECGIFTFKASSLDDMRIEFSICPNFGTKTIGRAVALPSLIKNSRPNQMHTLPILDGRLHTIGEVSFQTNVITSFSGVTLDVGGGVETYWRSTAVPLLSESDQPAAASPLVIPGHTISSLGGEYLYVVVQVTRDLQAVVYGDWMLPEPRYDLRVCDVTLEQFQTVAARNGRSLDLADVGSANDVRIAKSMVSLAELIQALPSHVGLDLELAYSASSPLDLNTFVNSVLHTIFSPSVTSNGGGSQRRKIVFTSFWPDVCSSLNWKQPNYPVVFASPCGRTCSQLPSRTAVDTSIAPDGRSASLDAAIKFAKNNNLLGLFVDADMLTQVPSLLQGIRKDGLLIFVWGITTDRRLLSADSLIGGTPVEAYLKDGVLTYVNHLNRE